uniref:Translational initiation factor 1 n=1 Tax=Begonia ferox TaxID=2974069 RepID=A0A977LII8_9ROSI|nr:translational initiation factor 1 [Begonia ferox]UXF57589.1 translational initiation factor 1 [Begonia ferox]
MKVNFYDSTIECIVL